MRLDKDLAEKLPLELALDEALQRPGDFFPSRIAFAAAKRSPSIFRSIRTNLVRDWKQATAESVQVPKWGGGTRPAIDIALRDRLVLGRPHPTSQVGGCARISQLVSSGGGA
jgi:hypothetical protein